MPGKLIAFILLLLVLVTFIGLNRDNVSDISLWFGEKGTIHDVPIFVSLFVMYVVGVLSVIPFIIGRWRKRARAKERAVREVDDPAPPKVRILGRRGRGSSVRGEPDDPDDEYVVDPEESPEDDAPEP